MAIRVAEKNPIAGKINKTPAPDSVSHVRAPTGLGYGQPRGPNPSSIDPGRQVLSPLAQNLKESVNDGGALDTVIAQGVSLRHEPLDDWQTRHDESTKPYPTTFGHHDPNYSNPKVPGAADWSSEKPVARKPE